MKPVSMETVKTLVFKSETTTEIIAKFNETIIKIKTNYGSSVGVIIDAVNDEDNFGERIVVNTETGMRENLFKDITEVYYAELWKDGFEGYEFWYTSKRKED